MKPNPILMLRYPKSLYASFRTHLRNTKRNLKEQPVSKSVRKPRYSNGSEHLVTIESSDRFSITVTQGGKAAFDAAVEDARRSLCVASTVFDCDKGLVYSWKRIRTTEASRG